MSLFFGIALGHFRKGIKSWSSQQFTRTGKVPRGSVKDSSSNMGRMWANLKFAIIKFVIAIGLNSLAKSFFV